MSGKSANIQASKALSSLLRHRAHEEGLPIRPDGFVSVQSVLAHPSIARYRITWESLQDIVASDSKGRFSITLVDGAAFIRANQGHTIELDEEQLLVEIKDPSKYPIVVHGTYMNAWASIREQGLKRMSRNHIHFAKGLPGDPSVKSGMRTDCNVFIFINLARAMSDGIRFFESSNGVVLSSGQNGTILPAYFDRVIDKHKRHLA
eukprot:TRINITY_DN12169_c0_g1_i1.p1 TRINITY_DN12169_c0_g1~~TRINITY_DN12169_c0_g1_i1.p1  ORF type:complete len:205 (-),score=41.31 TRINITY_DN12169_c0_g1_i1:166-780(-)